MNSSKHIKGFDTLRAISILLVLLTHLGLYRFFEKNIYLRTRIWLLCSGLTGVQIFFTISGFLITLLLFNEKSRNNTINIKYFFIRRFIRLLPPLILFYMLMLITMLVGWIPFNGVGMLFSICYVYNFIPNMYYSVELGHMWSLSVEEQFYLFWPFVLLYISRFKQLLWGIIFLLIICVVGISVIPEVTLHYKSNIYPLKSTFRLERWFIPAIAPVMIGALTATFLNFKRNVVENIFISGKLYFTIALVFFLSPIYIPGLLLPFCSLFQSAGLGIILLLIYFNQKSKVVRYFDNKWLAYIGKISYGIYVYQGFFLRTGPGGNLWVQQFPENILFTFIIAVISYECYEKKIMKMKSRFVIA